MLTRHRTAGLTGLILALGLAGCASKPTPPPPTAEVSQAPVADPNAVPLGKPYVVEPFEVILSTTDTAIKVGDVPFHAEVKRDGAAVTDANVKLTLSMPGMGMPGPSATLAPDNGGYTGTVRAGMAGEWQADVAVVAGDETAKAAFVFNVAE